MGAGGGLPWALSKSGTAGIPDQEMAVFSGMAFVLLTTSISEGTGR